MSDVPLGAFLSGGIDSSVVVALMAQAIRDAGQDVQHRLRGARTTASWSTPARVASHLGTDHHELVVKPRALELLPRLVWGMDEPFGDASMIPTYHVAEMARRHVTVALSGDGGDEAYARLHHVRVGARLRAGRRHPAAAAAAARRAVGRLLPADHPLGRKLRRLGLDVADRHLEVMAHFAPRELARRAGAVAARRDCAGHDPFQAARDGARARMPRGRARSRRCCTWTR